MATALLEKQKIEETGEDETGPVPYHWTVDSFYKAYDAGAFGYAKRLELIQGKITEKMPPGPRHASLADIVAQMLRDAMQPPFVIREEKPVHLAFDSELVPDITVVRGVRNDYRERHPLPENVAVLVEVADATVAYDTGGKALLYAQAGIADYWVVLAEAQAIIVHRKSSPEGYKEVTRLAGTDTISPLAAPEAVWTVNALLEREGASENTQGRN